MNGLSTFDPTGLAQGGIGFLFYLLAAGSLIFSISTIYSLIKYSNSRGLGFVVSLVYLMVYLALVSQGISIYNSLYK